MDEAPKIPAGWYPDQNVPGGQRYWDGEQWTEHRAPAAPERPVAETGPPRNKPPRWLLITGAVVAVLIVIAFIGGLTGSNDSTTNETAAAPSPSESQKAAPSTKAAPKSPKDKILTAIKSGNGDLDKPQVYVNRDGKQTVTVRFKIKDNFSRGLIRDGIALNTFAAAEAVKKSGVNYKTLLIQGDFPVTDKFGNDSVDQVFQVAFDRSTVNRINYSNSAITRYDNLDSLADGSVYLLPDLAK